MVEVLQTLGLGWPEGVQSLLEQVLEQTGAHRHTVLLMCLGQSLQVPCELSCYLVLLSSSSSTATSHAHHVKCPQCHIQHVYSEFHY